MYESPTSVRWNRLLSARDAMLIDAGLAGERAVARARLTIMIVITAIPIQAVLAYPHKPETWIGVAGFAFALVTAVFLVWMLHLGHYRPWLSMATSVWDVSCVSAILSAFILVGHPEIAVNSRIIWEMYLLALSATCLRYEPRIPLIAGVVAVLEYAVIVGVVHSRWDLSDPRYADYGTFVWGDQIGRLIILATAAVLAWAILRRAERLRQLTMHDPLTGLLNRNVLEERVREEVMRARRYGRPLSVAMIDLDLFKRFNDTYGHAAGDMALRTFSAKLSAAVRRTDIVARFGGEEFVVVMPETPGPDAAAKLEQIRSELEAMDTNVHGAAGGGMTLSAGVAAFDAEHDTGVEILQRADNLLLEAKRAGRNCVMSDSGRAVAHASAHPVPANLRVDGPPGAS